MHFRKILSRIKKGHHYGNPKFYSLVSSNYIFGGTGGSCPPESITCLEVAVAALAGATFSLVQLV
jgi:hypothetical protein